jgi:dihydropteroate synthase
VVSWDVSDLVRASLGGVIVGEGRSVAIMGAINVSPESFYGGSVAGDTDTLLRAATAMVEAGADLIDVGARSTAPYLAADIPESEEQARLARAVEILVAKLPVPVSADTSRPGPARAALEAGARVVNDVSGLADRRVGELAAAHGAGVVLMALPAPGGTGAAGPVEGVRGLLSGALDRARAAGLADEQVVLDPGIGFFRQERRSWVEWDLVVLADLARLRGLGRPLCVGVSRKSFLGAITGRTDPADRLAASLAATSVAVLHGAHVIRTHDVAATRDAVRVAERLRAAHRTGSPA